MKLRAVIIAARLDIAKFRNYPTSASGVIGNLSTLRCKSKS